MKRSHVLSLVLMFTVTMAVGYSDSNEIKKTSTIQAYLVDNHATVIENASVNVISESTVKVEMEFIDATIFIATAFEQPATHTNWVIEKLVDGFVVSVRGPPDSCIQKSVCKNIA